MESESPTLTRFATAVLQEHQDRFMIIGRFSPDPIRGAATLESSLRGRFTRVIQRNQAIQNLIGLSNITITSLPTAILIARDCTQLIPAS